MKTTLIKASVKISPKIRDTYYSLEYCEERSLDENDNVEQARKDLFDDVYNEVASQINDIINSK